jgi:hypothetical protein
MMTILRILRMHGVDDYLVEHRISNHPGKKDDGSTTRMWTPFMAQL